MTGAILSTMLLVLAFRDFFDNRLLGEFAHHLGRIADSSEKIAGELREINDELRARWHS